MLKSDSVIEQNTGTTPAGQVGQTVTVHAFDDTSFELTLQQRLNEGPYTELWKAQDAQSRLWALRLLPNTQVDEAEWTQVERLGLLQHAQAARTIGMVEINGQVGLVRHWVTGSPIDKIWLPNAQISDIEEVFRNVLAAVSQAHHLGIVHGGLKPARIYLDKDQGIIQVLDFAVGPWLPPRPEDAPWLPPEHRDSYVPDIQSDLYALGAILYWLATGEAPPLQPEPIRKRRPDLPRGLAMAIDKSLTPQREARINSCHTFYELVGKGDIGKRIRRSTESFPIGLVDADGNFDLLPNGGEVIKRPRDWQDTLPHEIPPPEELTGRVPTPPPPVVSKKAPAPRPPAPQTHNRNDGLLAFGAFFLILFSVGVLYFLNLPTPPPPSTHEVANKFYPPTISTIIDFSGSIQPPEVVVYCPSGYNQSTHVTTGRAIIDNLPDENGCSMHPRSPAIDRPYPVRQGNNYTCAIDKGILICQPMNIPKPTGSHL